MVFNTFHYGTLLVVLTRLVTAVSLSHAALEHRKHVKIIHSPVSYSFAGMNSYFLHAFQTADRIAVLDALKAAGASTVRIFISYTPANNKNTGSLVMPDVEPKTVGVWDDTQLRAIDQLMAEAKPRGIKLIIAMHDRYQLGCWGNDSYVAKYNLPAINCADTSVVNNDVTSWYKDPAAIHDFENRIAHIMMHRNELLGNIRWVDLGSHIFSLNIQNEGQGHLNGGIAPAPGWWCDRSEFMSKILGPKNPILISTGGGNNWSNSDIMENWDCPTIELVGLHSYDGADSFAQKGPGALQRAKASKTLVMVEEFGAIGATKAQNIQDHLTIMNEQLKIPWMVWQMSKPGAGASDYEIWTYEPSWGVIKKETGVANRVIAAQEFYQHTR